MASFLGSIGPNLVFSPYPGRGSTVNPVFQGTHFRNFTIQRTFLRGSLGVARFGLGQVPFPDPGDTEIVIKEMLGRVEGFLYTVADAAVTSAETVDGVTTTKQNSDWFSGITNAMEMVLKVLKGGLSTLHVPYAYGFAIILLTILVKAATFPLSKKQVESTMAMQYLAPQIKAIQERYAGDQERIQLETARLYKLAGINPLAGCLPTLLTIPVWIGLYRALSNVADEGLLTEGFFWIPSLSGPTTVAARQTGAGTSWLFPFVDGHPPLGWHDTLAYLVLPVLLILSQYISIEIMQPPQRNDIAYEFLRTNITIMVGPTCVNTNWTIGIDVKHMEIGVKLSNDPNSKNSQVITKLLPLMIGYFALSVPSGLSLYWFTNNILTTAQQVWLRKMGGAKTPIMNLRDDLMRKEQPQVLKTVSEAPAVEPGVKKEPKPTPQGSRRGERFKQLKEQEVQRKQRQEERRKAEEAVAKRSLITNGQANQEISRIENQDSSSSGLDGFLVNGNSVDSEAKTSEKMSADMEKDHRSSDDHSNERSSSLHVDKNIDKD